MIGLDGFSVGAVFLALHAERAADTPSVPPPLRHTALTDILES
jgi:hypothetical protein